MEEKEDFDDIDVSDIVEDGCCEYLSIKSYLNKELKNEKI